VKTFNLMGTKLHGLMTTDMFMDTWIHGFQIIRNITRVNKYFVGFLNSWIALPTKTWYFTVYEIALNVKFNNSRESGVWEKTSSSHCISEILDLFRGVPGVLGARPGRMSRRWRSAIASASVWTSNPFILSGLNTCHREMLCEYRQYIIIRQRQYFR